ncbi:hypothetical protein HFU87_13045, partial [Acidithiobacillus sp. CV18-3]|nr:hypothetical protein [Acidithiobacillus sp. CV18-3]
LGFTQMLSALQAGNYEQAAKAMLDSLWYQQTGSRAQALAEQMRTNRWQDTDTPSSTQA